MDGVKTLLTTLNAKYIHTSLALRLLYVANRDRFDLSFREFTIKEDPNTIADHLLAESARVIGFGLYIWNVEQTRAVILRLRAERPDLIIVLGGPEVSYEPEYFLNHWPVDYVVSGEGEFVLGELLEAIETGESEVRIPGVSSREWISREVVRADLERLEALPSPYRLEEDRADLQHRLLYFETSRGCPYSCQYCLSSLEKGVRYFSEEYIFDNLTHLIDQGVKQIKFLDRTFNLHRRRTERLFDFLIERYRTGLNCHFEIYADLLNDPMIDHLNRVLPPGFFRFEIGIQSTYTPTNEEVKRRQDFPLLAHNVRRLMEGGKIDLHLDLIAGLPFETFDRFRTSFNDVFALGAKEVQLGFLKMLRGTALRRNADRYGYRFSETAPYEITQHADLSPTDIARIHDAEHALEKYWNSGRFERTMHRLFEEHYAGRYFEFFDALGQFHAQHDFPHRGYQLEDLFRILHRFLSEQGIDLFAELRTDYYSCFTVRPHGFWEPEFDKKERKQILYRIGQDRTFLSTHGLTRKIIEKQTAIACISDTDFLLTLFLSDSDRNDPPSLTYPRAGIF